MTFDGTKLTLANDASISGLTVGKGGGALAGNTALGVSALAATNTGVGNIGIGYQALTNNTSGYANTAIGSYESGVTGVAAAMIANTTGFRNIAIGTGSLASNTSGSYGVGIGFQALALNTTQSNNTAVGYQALYSNTAGGSTAVGYQAGVNNSANGANCFFGYTAGSNNTTGYYSIYIGYACQPSASSNHDEIVIGSNGTGKGSNTGSINPGGGPVYQGNNSATWSIVSDARLKKNIVNNETGLDAISQIQVRNFEYRTKDEITELPSQNAIEKNGIQLGAIAQELQAILPDCVRTESTGVMSVNTENLTWYLINAVKELNAKVTALEAKLGA
jgi:hypothetical protein